jgi:hypothetical protein
VRGMVNAGPVTTLRVTTGDLASYPWKKNNHITKQNECFKIMAKNCGSSFIIGHFHRR